MKKLPIEVEPGVEPGSQPGSEPGVASRSNPPAEPRALLIARLRDELQRGTYRLDPEAISRALLSRAHDSSRRARAAPLNLKPLPPIGVRKH